VVRRARVSSVIGDAGWLGLIAAGVVGYLIGSIPTGVLVARVLGWPDPRTHGSGHTGALNVSRGAGRGGFITVALLDLIKGVAAVLIGGWLADHPYAIAAAGIAATMGHCWPVWLGFHGGMGLATGFGAVLPYAPIPAVIALAALLVIRKFVIKHSPRAVIAAMLTVPVSLVLLRASLPVMALGIGVAIVLIVRHTADWNRVYPSTKIE
jgi:acyl phosphate:glycerol-3-phosphate acyltransferase